MAASGGPMRGPPRGLVERMALVARWGVEKAGRAYILNFHRHATPLLKLKPEVPHQLKMNHYVISQAWKANKAAYLPYQIDEVVEEWKFLKNRMKAPSTWRTFEVVDGTRVVLLCGLLFIAGTMVGRRSLWPPWRSGRPNHRLCLLGFIDAGDAGFVGVGSIFGRPTLSKRYQHLMPHLPPENAPPNADGYLNPKGPGTIGGKAAMPFHPEDH